MSLGSNTGGITLDESVYTVSVSNATIDISNFYVSFMKLTVILHTPHSFRFKERICHRELHDGVWGASEAYLHSF
jgi:hypothetical protein